MILHQTKKPVSIIVDNPIIINDDLLKISRINVIIFTVGKSFTPE